VAGARLRQSDGTNAFVYPATPSIERGARELALRPPGNLVDAAKVPKPARFYRER